MNYDYHFPDFDPQSEGIATRIIQGILNFLAGLLDDVWALLPQSPFSDMSGLIPENPLINFVLWVVPVGHILTIMSMGLTAIAAIYLIRIVARRIGMIE
ncbi:MAG: hypothetical protein FWC70_12420 [Defluviitaleaceae bacterium]|nr:hypothetical protein [Defluviitaleaceae bacterium]